MLPARLPRTIRRPVAVAGIGYWSGEPIRVEFRPAPAGSGITFVRDDLGPEARVPAQAEYRIDIPRRTNLLCRGVRVDMVEHVLAALAGLGIDNCEVGVDHIEMPGCDGSSLEFVMALDSVGTEEQEGEVPRLEITETVRHRSGDSWIEARPAINGEYSVRFELDYSHDPIIGQQVAEVEIMPEVFRQEVAPCRTFVLEHEAQEFKRRGLGAHVSNRDILVFGESGLIDNELRFPNECARHKLLDVVGDMALTGCEIIGQIVAHRSGHRLHAALAQELKIRFGSEISLRATA